MDSRKPAISEGIKTGLDNYIVKDRVLSKGRKQCRPQHVIYFDTETKWKVYKDGSQIHKLRLGWGCYVNYRNSKAKKRREQWKYFTKQEVFHKWFGDKIKPKRTLYAIGSNVWFDMRITDIDLWLLSEGYRCHRLYDKGLVTIINYRKGDAAIIFLAIQNFFRLSVNRLGELLGLPKLKVDYANVSNPELSRYCRRDVEILVRAFGYWLDFIDYELAGTFGVTIGQQGLNIYRSGYMKTPIVIHTDEKTIELERAGYYGGRTEPFYIGKIPAKRIHKLDINSLYPYVMKKYKYPCRLLDTVAEPDIDDCYNMLDTYGITAMVKVNMKKPYLPVKVGKKTCFPVGTFDAVVSTEAFKRIVKDGSIVKVYLASYYEMGSIFKRYIEHFNKLKEQYSKEGDYLGRVCSKYIMNCLYGKWGQYREEIIATELVDIDLLENISLVDDEGNPCGNIVTYGGVRHWYSAEKHNANHSFVAISSHITENARLTLWDSMQIAGHKNYYYCDTDSLFVNDAGYKRLEKRVHKDRLGAWKHEGVFKKCIIYGSKDYSLDGKLVCKGIRPDAVELRKGVYQQYKFSTFRTYLDGNQKDGYKVEQITKRLRREYDKGIVTSSGWIRPFVLPF